MLMSHLPQHASPSRWRRRFTGEILHGRAAWGKGGSRPERRRQAWISGNAARPGYLHQSLGPGVVPCGGANLAAVAAVGCYAGGVAFSRARKLDSPARLPFIDGGELALTLGWPLATTHHCALSAVTLPIPVSNGAAPSDKGVLGRSRGLCGSVKASPGAAGIGRLPVGHVAPTDASGRDPSITLTRHYLPVLLSGGAKAPSGSFSAARRNAARRHLA